MLTSVTYHMSVEFNYGQLCNGLILVENEDGQYSWLADREFGPFTEAWDVTRWTTKSLLLDLRPRMI